MQQRTFVYVLMVLVGSLGLLPYMYPQVSFPKVEQGMYVNEYEPGTILFVGDIFLGRRVERMMAGLGDSYPFEDMERVLRGADVTVGNFEASVPEKHVPTPDLTFTFSVEEKYLRVLHEYGFDVLSLANNHAFDHDEKGFLHTREACARAYMVCGGHPIEITEYSLATTSAGETVVGFLFLHELWLKTDDEVIHQKIDELKAQSDVQIAFIHWGTEYVARHNDTQEEFAHLLVDVGMDAVIGHHPHVVQDIEIYDGKLIAYSLGNFIFDQYFSDEVQRGLAIELTIDRTSFKYEFIPISSIEERSRPKPMSHEDAAAFLSGIPFSGYDQAAFLEQRTVVLPREPNLLHI